MNGVRIWQFTDRLPGGKNVRYVLQDRGGSLRLDPEPSDPAIGILTSPTPLKILKFFIEKLRTEFSRDEVIDGVWPQKNDRKKTDSDYKNLNSQLSNLRNYFRDHDADEGMEESGRLLITINRTRLLKFGGHDIVLPKERAVELLPPSRSPTECAAINPLASLLNIGPSQPDERSRERTEDRFRRQAQSTVRALQIVRPILDLNLPNIDLSRRSHFVERYVLHYRKPDAATTTPVPVVSSASVILERLRLAATNLGLIAPVGMGKSQFLEQLAYLTAGLALANPWGHPLPIIIRLREVISPSDIVRQIERQLLAEFEGHLIPEDFDSSCFTAFVDGLDELPNLNTLQTIESALIDLIGDGIVAANRRLRANASVITSRPEGVHLCNLLPHFQNSYLREKGTAENVLSLEPLTVADQTKYVRQFFEAVDVSASGGSDLPVKQLEDSVCGTVNGGNPLLLFLFCYLNGYLPPGSQSPQPKTSTQLLLAGIRQSLKQRGIGITDAHLVACSCLAFQHRTIGGALSADRAIKALGTLCARDLDDPGGLAAQLGIRHQGLRDAPEIDHPRLIALVTDVLCLRSGLMCISNGYIYPANARTADLLVALHLRGLITTFTFGYVWPARSIPVNALACIRDLGRSDGRIETVAQAVSRWAWDERWNGTIQDLAALLAQDGNPAPLIGMLADYMPIPNINRAGDDDAGHRLNLASVCLSSAKLANPKRDFEALDICIQKERSLRCAAPDNGPARRNIRVVADFDLKFATTAQNAQEVESSKTAKPPLSSRAIREVIDTADFKDALAMTLSLAKLSECDLDFAAIYESLVGFAERFCYAGHLDSILAAALICRAKIDPQPPVNRLRELVDRLRRDQSRRNVVATVARFGVTAVKDFGMLWEVVRFSLHPESNCDFGHAWFPGFDFLESHAAELLEDQSFLSTLTAQLGAGSSQLAPRMVHTLIRGARSRDLSIRLFSGLLVLWSTQLRKAGRVKFNPRLFHDCSESIFPLGIRFRLSWNGTVPWVETTSSLIADELMNNDNRNM